MLRRSRPKLRQHQQRQVRQHIQRQRPELSLQERNLRSDIVRLRLEQGSVGLVKQAFPAYGHLPRLRKMNHPCRRVACRTRIIAVDAVRADTDVDEAKRIVGRQPKKQVPVFDAQAFAPAVDGVERASSHQGNRAANRPMTDHGTPDAVIRPIEVFVGTVQTAHAAVMNSVSVFVDDDRITDHGAFARMPQ